MNNKNGSHFPSRRLGAVWGVGMLLGAAAVQTAHAQASTTLDEQEQLRRAQAEAAQRAQAINAPNVQLQAPAARVEDDGKVPVESPCFKLDQLSLVVPAGLSDRVETAGARALLPNPLFPGELMFAQNYL